jgi:chromosome segregation ATPase
VTDEESLQRASYPIGLSDKLNYTELERYIFFREVWIVSTEERLSRVENAFVTITHLAESMSERMDQHLDWINQLGEAQTNADARIAALADAQIRTEERMVRVETTLVTLVEAQARLVEAQTRTESALARLADAQTHTDQKLDALINVVREGRNDKS